MAQPTVAVVTDSASALPHAFQAKYDIRVVPMHIAIDEEVFTEGVNISPPKVVAAQLLGSKVRTFEPPVAEFSHAYQGCIKAGYREIVSIHVSCKIHKVYAHAQEAARTMGTPVTVIDSGTVTMAEGWVVLAAAAVAKAGGDAEDVVRAAREAMETSRLLFTVETLDYVHQDGRVSGAIRLLSNATHMRPILTIKDGDIALAGRERQTGPAREKVRTMMQDYAKTLARPVVSVALVGGSALEEGLGIDTPGLMIEDSPGASLTAHAGPGTYAVAVADMPLEFIREI
ncbi:MAG: DegV family EDD domain-containing protein [Demequinaceae bacterium]|nr:DegV family EDD domain-containing protein [Demequinaceae bacterium]